MEKGGLAQCALWSLAVAATFVLTNMVHPGGEFFSIATIEATPMRARVLVHVAQALQAAPVFISADYINQSAAEADACAMSPRVTHAPTEMPTSGLAASTPALASFKTMQPSMGNMLKTNDNAPMPPEIHKKDGHVSWRHV